MSKIKFQHYVPRFYLEAYTDSNGMVWVFDKLTRRIFSTKPENIAGENYFYDVPQIESPSELNQALEKAFSIHEDEASKIIAYLDGAVFQDDFQPLDQNNRQTLATYIALQIMRVPKYREFLRKFINHVPDEISRDIKKFVDEDERIINLLIFDNETSINNYAKMLADQIWVFARNTTDSPFYTSDNPVLFKTKDNKFWTPPVEPITHGVEIVFPLSPDVILYVMEKTYFSLLEIFDGQISPVEFTEFMVEHENSGQVGLCKRYVFSCQNNFTFANKYLDSNPEKYKPSDNK